VSFAAITLCVASQRVFILLFIFVIDSVWKRLDTPSYMEVSGHLHAPAALPPEKENVIYILKSLIEMSSQATALVSGIRNCLLSSVLTFVCFFVAL
jgi:hypothetical protein